MNHPGAGAPAYAEITGASMGTTWSVKLHDPGDAALLLRHDIQAALDEIVAQMSTWDAHSAISRLNRAEPGWYQVAPAFFHVLSHALELAADTDGAYDPTLGALTNLWGFGPPGPVSVPPSPAAVSAALADSGWRRTAINAEHRAVWQPGGLQFDLSSIAKGHGVDEIARVLDEAGVTNYLAELGGELKARGVGTAGKAWGLNIEDPDKGDNRLPIMLVDAAVATSGDYRRHFVHQGKRYSHTLDPRSGAPLPDEAASVTVIHPQCMMADGLATALLALGPKNGLAQARRHGIAALFMNRHKSGIAVEWTDEFSKRAAPHTPLPCI